MSKKLSVTTLKWFYSVSIVTFKLKGKFDFYVRYNLLPSQSKHKLLNKIFKKMPQKILKF